MSSTITFFFAFVAVLALIGGAAWLVRRFANNRLGANTQRGRLVFAYDIDVRYIFGTARIGIHEPLDGDQRASGQPDRAGLL